MAEINHVDRKMIIVYLLATVRKPTPGLVTEKSGIPTSSVKRIIADLRDDYKMTIDFVREKGFHGKSGYYKISDWGILGKKSFMKKFDPSILQS